MHKLTCVESYETALKMRGEGSPTGRVPPGEGYPLDFIGVACILPGRLGPGFGMLYAYACGCGGATVTVLALRGARANTTPFVRAHNPTSICVLVVLAVGYAAPYSAALTGWPAACCVWQYCQTCWHLPGVALAMHAAPATRQLASVAVRTALAGAGVACALGAMAKMARALAGVAVTGVLLAGAAMVLAGLRFALVLLVAMFALPYVCAAYALGCVACHACAWHGLNIRISLHVCNYPYIPLHM